MRPNRRVNMEKDGSSSIVVRSSGMRLEMLDSPGEFGSDELVAGRSDSDGSVTVLRCVGRRTGRRRSFLIGTQVGNSGG